VRKLLGEFRGVGAVGMLLWEEVLPLKRCAVEDWMGGKYENCFFFGLYFMVE
jgi:hypothetical protein